MQTHLAQVAAMIRYEFLMQWRQRTLLVITLAMLVIPILAALLLRGTLQGIDADPDAMRHSITMLMITSIWSSVYVVLAFIFPIGVAEIIPKDHYFKVHDLLRSRPLPIVAYLIGKVIGMWVAAAACIAVVALIAGVVWWLMVGPFDIGTYLAFWIVGALVLIGLNSGLSVLLAASQPNRRRGVMIAVVYVFICMVFLGMGLRINTINNDIALGLLLNPARPALFIFFFSGFEGMQYASFAPEIVIDTVWLTLAFGLIELVAVGALMWGWLRWRDGRH